MTTVPTPSTKSLEDLIATLTGIEPEKVKAILTYIEPKEPQIVEEAKEIVNSNYATPEQKESARAAWARISEADLVAATTFRKAIRALEQVDRSDGTLLTKGVQQCRSLATSLWDLTELASLVFNKRNGFPEGWSDIFVGSICRALLPEVTDMSSAVSVWGYFKGTDYETLLIDKMRGFVNHAAADSNADRLLDKMYHGLPSAHPLRGEVLKVWIKQVSSADRLREMHTKFVKRLEEIGKKPSSSGSDAGVRAREVRHLEEAIASLTGKMDHLVERSMVDVWDHEQLVAAFATTRLPVLYCSQVMIGERLYKHWMKQLRKEHLTFAEAKATYIEMKKVLENHKHDWLELGWNAMKKASTSAQDAREMVDLAGHGEWRKEAISLWLVYDPSFNEMLELIVQLHHCEQLEMPLLKKVESFDQALRLCQPRGVYTDEAREELLKKAAMLATGLQQTLGMMEQCTYEDTYKGRRVSVLKRALEFVIDEFEFGMVKKYLENGCMHHMEERLLVEKAKVLLSR